MVPGHAPGAGPAVTVTGWRTSSHSNGTNCAEVGTFRKSSRSTYNGNCLEAGSCSHGVAVRDTRNRSGPVLKFSGGAWRQFLAAVKASPVG